MKVIFPLILITAAFAAGYFLTKPSACGADCETNIYSVNAQDFSKELNSGEAMLLDIRTPQEFSSGHIDKAVNNNFYETEKFNKFLGTLDKNGKYLIYCRTGNRSGQALKIMEEKGFTNVVNLSEGIESWQKAGYPVTN